MIQAASEYGTFSIFLRLCWPKKRKMSDIQTQLESLRKRNNDLIKSNIKYATLSRQKTHQVIELEKDLATAKFELNRISRMNHELNHFPPFAKIQKICKAAIEEYMDLVGSIRGLSLYLTVECVQAFDQHALVGLEAIVAYDEGINTRYSYD